MLSQRFSSTLHFVIFTFRCELPNNNSIEDFSQSNIIKENETTLEIGLRVEKTLVIANNAFSGIVMTYYTTTIGSLIVISFMFVGVIGLNNTMMGNVKYIFGFGLFLAILMHLIRMYIIMDSAQNLGNEIKKSKRVLEDAILSQDNDSGNEIRNVNKTFVLWKRLEVYQMLPPISPYSVVSLGHRTFWATLASIITYIVVLIKLRGLETSKTCPTMNIMNETQTT